MKLNLALFLILALFPLVGYPHDENCVAHCHRAVGYLLEDWPDMKDKESCKQNAGRWRHHHPHCHAKSDTSRNLDSIADKYDCSAQNGVWSDNGHDLRLRP